MPATPPASLAAFVDNHVPADKELPFFHSTRCEFFPKICSAGALSPRECSVFKEPLLYFFYGRPAYRSKAGALPNTTIDLMPICLVFKPGVLDNQLYRAFPFDTGAAHGGLFLPHIDPNSLLDFRVTPALPSIKKAISAFFGTNERYFAATPKPSLAAGAPSGLTSLDCYCALLTAEGEALYDDRRAAIEAQTSQSVTLKDALHSVILPTPFLADPVVRNAIVNEWRAMPVRYNHVRGSAPSEYIRDIVAIVRDVLERGDYF